MAERKDKDRDEKREGQTGWVPMKREPPAEKISRKDREPPGTPLPVRDTVKPPTKPPGGR